MLRSGSGHSPGQEQRGQHRHNVLHREVIDHALQTAFFTKNSPVIHWNQFIFCAIFKDFLHTFSAFIVNTNDFQCFGENLNAASQLIEFPRLILIHEVIRQRDKVIGGRTGIKRPWAREELHYALPPMKVLSHCAMILGLTLVKKVFWRL
jgi:hypothetical protein